MITLQFVRQNSLISSLIAWFSQGTVSHVEAIIDGVTLGSFEQRVNDISAGVQRRPLGYAKLDVCVRVHLPVDAAQEKRFRDFLTHQIGKPYDWSSILGFIFGRYWREDDAWICSELQAAALEDAGIVPPLFLAASKITPTALLLTLSALPNRTIEVIKQ